RTSVWIGDMRYAQVFRTCEYRSLAPASGYSQTSKRPSVVGKGGHGAEPRNAIDRKPEGEDQKCAHGGRLAAGAARAGDGLQWIAAERALRHETFQLGAGKLCETVRQLRRERAVCFDRRCDLHEPFRGARINFG